jgi:DedD protein
MDQGLKERLVGAAVLVAIAVWLIPWVLDGPENPVETGPASLQLPASQEPVPMRTQTLKLGEPPAAAQPADTTTEKTEAPAETVVAAATPEPAAAASVSAPPPAAPTAAVSPPAATTQAPKPANTEIPRKPAATPPTAAASPSKGDWTVQLGVFGDENNARRLVERASTFGYKAGLTPYKVNGKTMYRVRVGAYGSKGQAEATASALSAHGITGKVVAAD